jgi:hypothetical protein
VSRPRKRGSGAPRRKPAATPVRRWRTAAPRKAAQPTAAADVPAAARKPMRRTIRGGRPYFFDDPAIDKVLNMVVVLGSEVWTLRERLAALEAVQVRRGGLATGEVDAHEFSPEDEARLAGQRKEFIDSLFRILQEQVELARGRAAKAAGD